MEDKPIVLRPLLRTEKAGVLLAPLDFESCADVLGGDREAVVRLLGGFLTDLNGEMDVISAALAREDHDVVRKTAHSIKGGAAVLFAFPLMDAAAILEETGRSGDLVNGVEELSMLAEEVACLRNHYKELMKKND